MDIRQLIVTLETSFSGLMFEPLRNLENFKNFHLNRWTIEWKCGADFAPEYLYDLALKQKQALQDA